MRSHWRITNPTSCSTRRTAQASCSRIDLRQFEELDHCLALGDALRAEGHVDVKAEASDQLFDHCRHTGIDGAPQDQQLPIHELLADLGDGFLYGVEIRVEVFVDGCPNHDNNVLCTSHGLGIDRQRTSGGDTKGSGAGADRCSEIERSLGGIDLDDRRAGR